MIVAKIVLHHRISKVEEHKFHQYAFGGILVCKRALNFPSTPKKRKNIDPKNSFFLRGEAPLLEFALQEIPSVNPSRNISGYSIDQILTGMQDL